MLKTDSPIGPTRRDAAFPTSFSTILSPSPFAQFVVFADAQYLSATYYYRALLSFLCFLAGLLVKSYLLQEPVVLMIFAQMLFAYLDPAQSWYWLGFLVASFVNPAVVACKLDGSEIFPACSLTFPNSQSDFVLRGARKERFHAITKKLRDREMSCNLLPPFYRL